MYKRILVPLDGSACSEAALPHARAMAEKFEAELVLMRVVEPTPVPVPMSSMAVMDGGLWTGAQPGLAEIEETREEVAEEYIEETARRIEGPSTVVTEVEWGGAAHEIVECAEEHQVDLIVLAAHDRSFWERLFMGSTSEGVLHETHIPLLIVKYRPQEEIERAGA